MGKKKRKSKSKTTLKKKEEEFTFRGYTLAKLKKMRLEDLAELMCARQRRKLKRGLREGENKLLEALKSVKSVSGGGEASEAGESVKTHLRDALVLPGMVGKKVGIHNGKSFEYVEIKTEMIGHYLGELALTRKRVLHGAAGVGATRSSKYVPLR
ncbi:30S ribosomal protein S19 [ANME-1 cluster archaeon ex4572_4]|nr:30S ribosomal protein S19 [Methanophagales archaeon]OYT66489.1 MAG: 30S ribosomal protein S19 [ANME-1 cluster archaeon ex4572_4]PXF50422.1 MAG: 30S ribosomal protein S19 [Methanophagales archaeon]HDN68098.1 30S ribosomal protein S19 [Methanomicrobia archaeon]